MRHIYGRNCVLHYFCADRRRNLQIIPTKAKWPLGKEKPLVVKTMQVTVSLADARNLYGAESRTRTDDLLITNQILFILHKTARRRIVAYKSFIYNRYSKFLTCMVLDNLSWNPGTNMQIRRASCRERV